MNPSFFAHLGWFLPFFCPFPFFFGWYWCPPPPRFKKAVSVARRRLPPLHSYGSPIFPSLLFSRISFRMRKFSSALSMFLLPLPVGVPFTCVSPGLLFRSRESLRVFRCRCPVPSSTRPPRPISLSSDLSAGCLRLLIPFPHHSIRHFCQKGHPFLPISDNGTFLWSPPLPALTFPTSSLSAVRSFFSSHVIVPFCRADKGRCPSHSNFPRLGSLARGNSLVSFFFGGLLPSWAKTHPPT